MLTSSVGASVGVDNFSGSGGGSQTTYAFNAGLFYTLSPTVTTSARYIFEQRTGTNVIQTSPFLSAAGTQSRTGTENTFFVGLRKSF